MENTEFLFQDKLQKELVGNGIERQIMGYDDNIMLVKVMFESGSVGTLHAHPHVQTSYIASGKFQVQIDEKIQVLSTGDGFFVPSGKTHGVICLEAGIIIDVFSPHREDFLNHSK